MDILDIVLGKKLKGGNSSGTTIIGGSGDIIQDPDDVNGGMVVATDGSAVDKTLTMDNYAADAKIVGEKIKNLSDNLNQNYRTQETQDKIDNRLSQRIDSIETSQFPNTVFIGEPLIIGGTVSRFTKADYMIFPFMVDVRNKPFSIEFAFSTGSDITSQQNILDSHFGLALAIQDGRGIMALSSNGESWDIGLVTGTMSILPNANYYARIAWDGSAYTGSLSTDGTTYMDDMYATSSAGLYPQTMYIGGAPDLFGANSSHPFKGTIDMGHSQLIVDGIEVWRGMDDTGLASRANVSLSNLDALGAEKFKAENLPYKNTTVALELSDLKSDIVKLNPLVDSYANYKKDKAIKNQNGLIGDEAGVCTSDFIGAQATHSLTVTSFSDASRGMFYIILYDANKNTIGYWTAGPNRTFTAKEFTAYIRFSFVNGFAATVYDNTSKTMLYTANTKVSLMDNISADIKSNVIVAPVLPDITSRGWRLKSDGLSATDSSMEIRKYAVIAGRTYTIKTTGIWQYQHGKDVNVSGAPDVIGGTHSGDSVTIAPDGANFLMVNALQTAAPDVYAVYPSIENTQANPLYGKKYIAAGDSYTAWSDAAYIDSKYAGKNVTYDREIRIRYGMSGDNAGISGSTMAITKASHPDKTADDVVAFSNTRYTEIPADTDILTIAFGINDAGKCELGQLGDTENTTFYGAWHKVLTYYAQNRPETKVGIICFQRFDNGYYRAVLEIAKHYGVPLLDFFGGADTPIYVDGKAYDVDASIKEARKEYWGGHAHSTETEETFRGKSYMLKVSDGNPGHPGYRAHIDEASIIAEFLKRL